MKKYFKPVIRLIEIETFTLLSGSDSSGYATNGGFTPGDKNGGIGVVKNDPHHGGEDEL
mgnify:FL=1